MNPDIQKEAQQEVDAVVGALQFPTMDDIAELPYVQAVFMESLRWIPVLPLNVQHDALEDDEYEGYMIPRGFSVVVVRRRRDPARFSISSQHYRRQNTWSVNALTVVSRVETH